MFLLQNYDDMFIASKSDTEQQIKDKKCIYEEVDIYAKKMGDDSNQKSVLAKDEDVLAISKRLLEQNKEAYEVLAK